MINAREWASGNLTDADYGRSIRPESWFETAARSDPSNIVERRENRYRELLALPAGETGTLFEGLAPDGDPLDGLRAMQAYASGGRPDVELSPAAQGVFEGWADDERRHSFAAAEAGILQGMVGWGYNNPVEAATVTLASLVLTPAGAGITRLAQAASYGGRTALFEGGLELFAGMHRRAEAKASFEAALGEDYDLLANTAIEVLAAGGLGGIFGALEGAIRKPSMAGAVVKPGDTLLARLFPKHEKIVVDGREVEIGKMTHDDMMGVLREKFGARPYYFPVGRAELADSLPAADLEKFDELPGQEGELTGPQLEFLRERGIEPERGIAIDAAWVSKLGLPDEIVGQNRVKVGNDFIYTSLHPVLENALLTTKLRQAVDAAIRPETAAPPPDPAVGPDVEGGEIRANFREIVRDLGDEDVSLRTDDPDGVAERIMMWYNTAFLAKVPRARRERFNPAGKDNSLFKQHARELIFKSILRLKEGGELDEAFTRQAHEEVRGPYMTRDDAIKAGIDPQLLNAAGAHTPELLILELGTKDRATPRYFLAKYSRAGGDHPHEVLRELTEAELRGAGGEAGVRPHVRTYKPMLEKRPVAVKWHPIVPEKGGSVIWNPDDPTKRDLLDPLEATGNPPPARPDPHAKPEETLESAPVAPAPEAPPPKPEIVENAEAQAGKAAISQGQDVAAATGNEGAVVEPVAAQVAKFGEARARAKVPSFSPPNPNAHSIVDLLYEDIRNAAPDVNLEQALAALQAVYSGARSRRFSAGPNQEKDGAVFLGGRRETDRDSPQYRADIQAERKGLGAGRPGRAGSQQQGGESPDQTDGGDGGKRVQGERKIAQTFPEILGPESRVHCGNFLAGKACLHGAENAGLQRCGRPGFRRQKGIPKHKKPGRGNPVGGDGGRLDYPLQRPGRQIQGRGVDSCGRQGAFPTPPFGSSPDGLAGGPARGRRDLQTNFPRRGMGGRGRHRPLQSDGAHCCSARERP